MNELTEGQFSQMTWKRWHFHCCFLRLRYDAWTPYKHFGTDVGTSLHSLGWSQVPVHREHGCSRRLSPVLNLVPLWSFCILSLGKCSK